VVRTIFHIEGISMKLRYSPTSPYVRKVMVVAIETGLEDQIEIVPTDPWDSDTDLPADNPLGKVPALLTDDGLTLFDSPVICEFLDTLHDGQPLFPPVGEARWKALRWQALGDGILDACVMRRVEQKFRKKHLQSLEWIARQQRTIERSLEELNRGLSQNSVTIGHVSVGCALGYLDLRFPEDEWRALCPSLAIWYEIFSQRSSMLATRMDS
jgi:glutathione S-transferase